MTETGKETNMSNAMVVAGGSQVVHTSAAGRLEFTAEQEKLIRDMYGNGASPTEFGVFMEICRSRRLNPLLRQIYFVSRSEWQGEGQPRKKTWTVQVGIDGFRALAEDTGEYDGQDEPEFSYLDENDKRVPFCAKVRVYRKGIPRPFVGVAFYSEYVQKGSGGGPNKMWGTMPHNQLAKCAEALGLRKAFPEKLSGMYTPDEMAQADNPVTYDAETGEVVEDPQPPQPPRGRAPRKASAATQPPPSAPTQQPAGAVTGATDADAALADDLKLTILDASTCEQVKTAMASAGSLQQPLCEDVLVSGYVRLLDLCLDGEVAGVHELAREHVAAGKIRPAAAKAKITPAIDRRRSAVQSSGAAA